MNLKIAAHNLGALIRAGDPFDLPEKLEKYRRFLLVFSLDPGSPTHADWRE
jgi:hypothetical protein